MPPTVRQLVKRVSNHLQDYLLGISTAGKAPAEMPGHVHYATVSYSCTKSIIRMMDLNNRNVFIDIGCGKGRVVCLAARHKIQEAIGIEYSPSRAREAELNVSRLRGRKSKSTILCGSAQEADYSEATVIYFFNLFEPYLLDATLKKIRADRNDRPTRMAFVMESAGHKEVFRRHSWLVCYERFEDEDGHDVAFYQAAKTIP